MHILHIFLQTSHHQSFFFLLFYLISSLIRFNHLLPNQTFSSSPFSLSWGLGTLGRVSPTGCVGREPVSDSPTACPLAYQAGTRTQSRAERGGQGGKHGALK